MLFGPLASPALAFAPQQDAAILGSEPARLYRYWPDRQARLAQSEGWTQWTEGAGEGWKARFDEKTGMAHRAWGPGIELGALESADDVALALLELLRAHPELTGLDDDELALSAAGYVEHSDTWHVQLERLVDGVPMVRSGVNATIKRGRLIHLRMETHPAASELGTSPELGAETAIEEAISQGPAFEGAHDILEARLVVLPLQQGGLLTYELAWETTTESADPLGRWVSYVDAHNGDLLSFHNDIRFASGEIQATHDLRWPSGDLVTSPVRYANVFSAATITQTDELGAWTVEDEEDGYATQLRGAHVQVNNGDGDDASAALYDGETYTWTDEDATMAEIDSYVFLHDVWDWLMVFAPEVTDLADLPVTSNVNLNSSCNAYYDGNSVNFYKSGGSCNNTGRLADVNYHEWGHGFHYDSRISGTIDGSVGEGAGDTVSFLLTGDSTIAPGFYVNGSGIREVASDRVYPDDWTGEVHSDGLIFGGAVWDLIETLQTTSGLSEEEAWETTSALFAAALKGGPDVPGSYDAFVAADDDDGDLGNGTPNQCAIYEAFARHGLGPNDSTGAFSLAHTTVENQPAADDITVALSWSSDAPDCADGEDDTVSSTLFWSIDDGVTWESVAIDPLDETNFEALIPGQAQGTIVQYYLEVDSLDGQHYAPAHGDIAPFTFYVGSDLVELHCDDFEDNDGEYDHELLEGDWSEGADDWHHGTPAGKSTDPDHAWSGNNIWGNDLGVESNWNGEYQPDKHNQLSSAVIDVSDATSDTLLLQFRRWLGVEDGYFDEARLLVDGEVVWTNHASAGDLGDDHEDHTLDEQWALHTVEVADVDGDGQIVISWEILSDAGLEFGGWNIDDVCVYGFDAGVVEDEPEDQQDEDPGDDTPADEEPTDTPQGDDVDGATGSTMDITGAACGCATTNDSPAGVVPWALGLLGLVGLRRRRA